MHLHRSSLALLLMVSASGMLAQPQSSPAPTPRALSAGEFYAGYSYLTGSFNKHGSFSNSGLNGWDTGLNIHLSPAFGVPAFGIKIVASGEYGTNLGQPQRPLIFLGGAQYSRPLGRETAFAHGLSGLAHLNKDYFYRAGDTLYSASNNSLAVEAGGGIDTPISRRFAWRVEGDLLYTRFSTNDNQIHGLPNYFGKFSTGLVFHF